MQANDRAFGSYVRKQREARLAGDSAYTLRKVAGRLGIQPTYLSKVERGDVAPPSEETIKRLARDLDEDPDVLLALAGKVSADLRAVILKRPRLFAQLLRTIQDAPDHALLRVVREVRNGKW
ncbi:MAG TPA: helix-turn-helix transcriptional regulator [Kiritimatiellia bacterium]|nr:helix-turn-helix transcriptional regulator [Kiritimatiellia bacterium]